MYRLARVGQELDVRFWLKAAISKFSLLAPEYPIPKDDSRE
jgi:hypothetical protein